MLLGHLDEHNRTIERDIDLIGTQAVEWLSRHGAEATCRGPLHIYADALETPRASIHRISHTPFTLRAAPSAHDPGDVKLQIVIVIEGDLTVETNGGCYVVTDHSYFVTVGDRPMASISAAAAAAWIGVTTRDDQRMYSPTDDGVLNGVFPLPSGTGDVLLAVINSILGSELSISQTGFRQVLNALASACGAMLLDSVRPRIPVGTPAQQNIYLQAIQEIEDTFMSAGVSVETIAQQLNITPRYLQHCFSLNGTSGSAEIRQRRVGRARWLLSAAQDQPLADVESIARAAGFVSVRAMRTALREAETEQAR